MRVDANKELVRSLVEAVNARDEQAVAALTSGRFATLARRWVRPFQASFPDFRMQLVDLVAEGDTVVAHFRCSGTHEGEWLGLPPTGRAFTDVDEIYVFRVEAGAIVDGFGIEDNLSRLRQLGVGFA